jgi:hypothetical protein
MKRLHPDAEDNDLVKEMLKVKPHIDEKAAFRAVEEVDRMVSSFESDLIPF